MGFAKVQFSVPDDYSTALVSRFDDDVLARFKRDKGLLFVSCQVGVTSRFGFKVADFSMAFGYVQFNVNGLVLLRFPVGRSFEKVSENIILARERWWAGNSAENGHPAKFTKKALAVEMGIVFAGSRLDWDEFESFGKYRALAL